MTTIAIKAEAERGWVFAADSKCTDGLGAFCTRAKKLHRLSSGAVLGQAGDTDIRDILALLNNITAKRLPSRKELAETHCEFAGILAFPNGKVFLIDVGVLDFGHDSEWYGSVVELQERYAAVGSGQQFAIGAMAAGRSAKQAVEIACRYDSFSQAPVIEEPVKPIPVRKRG
jgi:ATP-dependent protease HslVU (ClpYQ) peptidase subunit